MRKIWLVIVLASCGSGPGTDETPCDPTLVQGAYRATYQALSGNCGDNWGGVVNFSSFAMDYGNGCTTTNLPTDLKSCSRDVNITCTASGGAWTYEITLHMNDADSLSSTETKTFRTSSGAIDCQGTYSVIYTRQP
jgi:hypothetical protein